MIYIANLDKATLEDCKEMYEFKGLCTVVENGHIKSFKEDDDA